MGTSQVGQPVQSDVQTANQFDPAFFAWFAGENDEVVSTEPPLVDPTSDDLDLDETGNQT